MDKVEINIEQQLKVPIDAKLRNRLRKEARLLISKAAILPPVGFERLQELASKLLKSLQLDQEYLDFAIVLCGNEVWREVISAVPFNRRLLLLPQCLKDSKSCQGTSDDLGLLCAGCKGCQIDELLNEAESLGYTTLIAEGTTVAIGLVEEGAIDAVIGVSCMSVLQRSFNPVSKVGIPVMGLPLLYDGCKDTRVDSNWVLEELRIQNSNSIKCPLSVSILKGQVKNYFNDVSLQKFFTNNNQTEYLARKMLMIGGQRIRPLLSILAYCSYSSVLNHELQTLLSIIIECFHKASLVHDDAEDDDDFRYEHETLHKTHGIPIAINVGDYLIGKGYQLLSQLPVDPEILVRSLNLVATSHLNLSTGQGADLMQRRELTQLSVNQQLQLFALKTGEAIKVALLLGAINGQANSEEVKLLGLFADNFGIAYQIRDDLNEFREEQKTEHVHHYPFLLALFNEKLTKTGNHFQISNLPSLNPAEIHQLLIGEQIDFLADAWLKQYIDMCYQNLDQLQNLKMKLSLYGVMGKIF